MQATLKILFIFSTLFCNFAFADTTANVIPAPAPAPTNTTTTIVTTLPNPNTATQPTVAAPPIMQNRQTPPQQNVNDTMQQNTGSALSDADITTNIQAKMMGDSSLTGANISVTTRAGIVTLEGSAHTQAQADTANRLAQAVNGVKSVQSKITVLPSNTMPAGQ